MPLTLAFCAVSVSLTPCSAQEVLRECGKLFLFTCLDRDALVELRYEPGVVLDGALGFEVH